MDKKDKNVKGKNENWMDDVMERQKKYVEEEEEILSNVPQRMKQKYLDIEEE